MRTTLIGLLVLLVMGIGADTAEGAVRVEILPYPTIVAKGEVFDLELTVPEAGSFFNAYETRIEYDPAVLTFIRLSPLSLQEGALFKNACANRWHLFDSSAPGVITISHAILCAGVKVAGPGVLYRLRFQAANLDVETAVRIVEIVFADAGVQVLPVYPVDGVVRIGNPVTGVGDDPASGPAASALAAFPNPFRADTRIAVQNPGAGVARLSVIDLRGREIRAVGEVPPGAGEIRAFTWDGRDDRGNPVAPGIYWLRLDGAGMREARKIVRLP